MEITGRFFPFDMLTLHSMLLFEPYVGYEANTGKEGSFTFTVPGYSASRPSFDAGETINFRLGYSDYDRDEDEVIFIAVQNECWGDDEFFPIFSKKFSPSSSGSGYVNIAWTVPYMDFLSVLETDNYKDSGIFDFAHCDVTSWTATARLASQPWHEIDKTNTFSVYVNYQEDNWVYTNEAKGLGVTRPTHQSEIDVAQDYVFNWDDENFKYFHHEIGMEVGEIKTVETVEVKLLYTDCANYDILGVGCTEHYSELTGAQGTPNDGSASLYVDECTAEGHVLSDADHVYAIVSGKENTNVVARSSPFKVKAPTCSSSDSETITISVRNANLRQTGSEQYAWYLGAKGENRRYPVRHLRQNSNTLIPSLVASITSITRRSTWRYQRR